MQKFLILISLIFLGACTGRSASPITPGMILTPSPLIGFTSSPDPTSTPTKSPIPSVGTVILPTPTFILYTVEQNDTLTGIARKFNLDLEELLSANPSVGSQALTVGLVLIIPPPQRPASESTATPWPVSIQQTQCYQNQDGSLWCLALLNNEYPETLQNLSVDISLLDSNGNVVSNKIAYAPLDLLPSGRSMVIGALFPAPILDDVRYQTHLLTASRLPSSDKNYPPIHLQNNLVQVDWGGLNAIVSGQVALDSQNSTANRVWLLALAYDSTGKVIGFHRWESNKSLTSGEVLSFEFGVSSLGPKIDHIDLLVEAAQ